MERIVVILGHPDQKSLCGALAERYAQAATVAGHQVEVFRLGEMEFDPVLRHGYREVQPLEPDLIRLQAAIAAAARLVLVSPVWWGGMPALLKGMFDRVFLSGWAYRYRKDSPWWYKLLVGRRAEVYLTLDTPRWYYRWIYGAPVIRQLRRTILGFCGIAPVSFTLFSPVRSSTPAQRSRWLAQVGERARR
ncbi:Putative NADPH-quinone reductase (modulator of drug activity B) [Gulbenkiania indica]|uniref:Putative NADPH-quinone reductase (Modulator of drug activity B) n=1 Tax=Gulbenkiania indica TaxID=375574 RepID=A0A0K6H7F7_9NEIS|nr:NAD(P)H-dependent oxidoreductase [Gulbenkiania indica]CUA86931.1 Putative NADPH-quinone reductase (modulator of drug activity B) [Gulbenkiania indica]